MLLLSKLSFYNIHEFHRNKRYFLDITGMKMIKKQA